MTIKEAVRAMIAGAPVVYEEITYEKISGLVCRRAKKSGTMKVRAELLDMCGHSVTVARLRLVEWKDEDDRARAADIPPVHEDGPTPQEADARAAFWSGQKVLYEGDICTVSAMIIRSWVNYNYWLELELTRVSDGLVCEAWAGSVIYRLSEAAGDSPEPL